MPPDVATSRLTPHQGNTNAGLTRDKFPGAGAITHFYGIGSEAIRDIPAGSEISKLREGDRIALHLIFADVIRQTAIDYGDFIYEKGKKYKAPMRDIDWLHEHGMCIDNIRIGLTTDPQMGRGAFASRKLQAHQLVSPAPLQTYLREAFVKNGQESLLINGLFYKSCLEKVP